MVEKFKFGNLILIFIVLPTSIDQGNSLPSYWSYIRLQPRFVYNIMVTIVLVRDLLIFPCLLCSFVIMA